MAWSPFQRANAGIIWVEQPGDYANPIPTTAATGPIVRIIPAQFVKPYVKSNKSDIIDAEAIAQAATRPSMRFVEIKSETQVDIQALHRVRDHKVSADSPRLPDASFLSRIRSDHPPGDRQVQSRLSPSARNKVTVALAAKIARVAWVILTRPRAIYDRRIPTEA